ncbi:MAG: hypothetical protein IIZ39_14725, partial [Blautia sp.]|nr:hypothetical protein [Blautia sp.]
MPEGFVGSGQAWDEWEEPLDTQARKEEEASPYQEEELIGFSAWEAPADILVAEESGEGETEPDPGNAEYFFRTKEPVSLELLQREDYPLVVYASSQGKYESVDGQWMFVFDEVDVRSCLSLFLIYEDGEREEVSLEDRALLEEKGITFTYTCSEDSGGDREDKVEVQCGDLSAMLYLQSGNAGVIAPGVLLWNCHSYLFSPARDARQEEDGTWSVEIHFTEEGDEWSRHVRLGGV